MELQYPVDDHYPGPLLKTVSLELGYAAQNRKLFANINLVMAGKTSRPNQQFKYARGVILRRVYLVTSTIGSVEESLVTDDPLLESLKLQSLESGLASLS